MDISTARCPGCRQPMRITRLHCDECEVSLDGQFEISALGRLAPEEQLFVVAFLRSHGSIKKMEALFGISYPTVKNRLTAIVDRLDQEFEAPVPNRLILDQLARGEITVAEALEKLR